MPKAWDITAVKKLIKPAPAPVKSKSKNNCLYSSLIVLLFLAAALYLGKLGSDFISDKSASPTPSASASVRSEPTLSILNGSGRFEETDKVTSLVSAAGFRVNKTDTSINMYNKTVVYYQNSFEDDANRLVKALAGYNASAQKFTNQSNYNLAIIIGSR